MLVLLKITQNNPQIWYNFDFKKSYSKIRKTSFFFKPKIDEIAKKSDE